MENSLILCFIAVFFRKLSLYYKNSVLKKIMDRIGQAFNNYVANSSILGFFDKEWNIAAAWKHSFAFKGFAAPARLLGYTSVKLADGTNSILEGSGAVSSIANTLESLFYMSTRVYGLLFLTFAAVQELVGVITGSGAVMDVGGIIRLALLLLGTLLILVNRPVNRLLEGSVVGRIAYNFFVIDGRSSAFRTKGIGIGVGIKYKHLELWAAAAGILLGISGCFLPAKLFILAAGAAVGVPMVLWRYEIGVFAVVALIPLAPTMGLLGLILLTALSYIIRLFRGKGMSFSITSLDFLVVLFGIVLIYSTVTSYTPGNSMLTLLIQLAFIIFYFILINTVKTRQQLFTLVVLLALSTALVSLYGLYQLKTVGATSEAWVDTTLFEDIKARVGATFDNPNVLGEYLVLIIPITAAMLWGQRSKLSSLLTVGLAAIMLLCLVYTYSRGAYLGLMFAFALFAVLRDKRFVILGIIGLLLLPFVLPDSVINRFTSIGNLSDTSSSYRISVWLGSLKLAKDYWPSGIGLGLEPFKLIYPKYSLNAAYAHHSHNIYIQLVIETGIAGFVLFLSMIVVYYKTMLAGFHKTRDRFLSTFMIAIASGMGGYLVQGMVENIWYNNRVLLTFWVMLAFAMTAKKLISMDNEVLEI